MDTKRILLLGGTTEARDLAARLAARADLVVTLSLAGRTLDPAPQPVPVRSRGFGGVDGLASYLGTNGIDLVVDATHPFARQMSANARAASETAGVPLLRLERLGWDQVVGDRWSRVASVAEAAEALGEAPRRVFLAIGRLVAKAFEILRETLPAETPVIFGRAAGRPDERMLVMRLGAAEAECADMATCVVIGSPETRIIQRPGLPDLVYTPRFLPEASR